MTETLPEPTVPALDQLASALAAFQAEMPTVAKAHTATVKSDKGSYSYTYAGLADVSEAAMPLLAAHGLSFSCLPGAGVLTGLLLHSSGQSLTASLPINGATPQQVGSSLTYMRRYLLGCMTGLVTDDDDDGRQAEQASRAPRARKATKPAQETREDVLLDTSSPLAKRMYAVINEAGISESERLGYLSSVAGRQIESSKELTEREARAVIDKLSAAIEQPFESEPTS